jgi:hypothetical protein
MIFGRTRSYCLGYSDWDAEMRREDTEIRRVVEKASVYLCEAL